MSCMRDIIPIYNSLNVCLNSATTVFTKDRESSQLLNFLILETTIISQFYFSCLLRYDFLLISFTELKLESPYISCFYFRNMSFSFYVCFYLFFSFLFLTSLDITLRFHTLGPSYPEIPWSTHPESTTCLSKFQTKDHSTLSSPLLTRFSPIQKLSFNKTI